MRLRRSAPIRISDALEDSYDATGRWRDERLPAVDEETQPDDGPGVVGDDVDRPGSGAVAVEPPRRRRARRWIVAVALPACSLLAALAVPLAIRALRETPRPSAGTNAIRAAPRPPASVRLHPPRLRLRAAPRHAPSRHRRVRSRRRRPRLRVAAPRPVVPAPAPAARASGRPGGEFVLGAR